MESKKVAFLVTSLNSGGIENYLLRFLKYYDGEISPTVFCKSNEFGELESEYRKIKNICLLKFKIGYFSGVAYYKLYQEIKQFGYDSVCDFTGNFAGIPLSIARLASVDKRIAFYRGSTNHFKESILRFKYNKLMLQLVSKNATKILSNSKAALDFFYPNRSIDDSRFKVIYNGINSEKFNRIKKGYSKQDFDIPRDSFLVGHTGRYNSAKNHDTIIKIAVKLCTKYSNIYFMLCGKETDLYLGNSIKSNPSIQNNLKILGYRNDIPEILNLFDLFLFPSITEGQPNSLIEAMVSGLPIIASNIDPILETTPEEMHYRFKNPLDVEGFVAEIEKIYLSRGEISSYCCADWARTHFDHRVLFEQFYREL